MELDFGFRVEGDLVIGVSTFTPTFEHRLLRFIDVLVLAP